MFVSAVVISMLSRGQATVFPAAPLLGTAVSFSTFSGASAGITNQGISTKIHGSIGTNGASSTITGFTDAVTAIPYTPASYTGTVYGLSLIHI